MQDAFNQTRPHSRLAMSVGRCLRRSTSMPRCTDQAGDQTSAGRLVGQRPPVKRWLPHPVQCRRRLPAWSRLARQLRTSPTSRPMI